MKIESQLLCCLLGIASASLPSQAAGSGALTFIRSILNASPIEAERHLGKPDKMPTVSRDCDYLATCTVATYQKGKFEALYYNNRLKSLEVRGNEFFTQNAPEAIGFSATPPTWASSFVRSWRSPERRGTAKGPFIAISGIREINVFPPNPANDNRGYMIINVEERHDKRF